MPMIPFIASGGFSTPILVNNEVEALVLYSYRFANESDEIASNFIQE